MSDSAPIPTEPPASPTPAEPGPDYASLVKFLIRPFLESPDSMRVDCEISPRTGRVLVRLAIEGEDKGRVFGRGGRNVQAVRTALKAVAQASGRAAHLDVFGSTPVSGREDEYPARESPKSSNRPAPPKPRST